MTFLAGLFAAAAVGATEEDYEVSLSGITEVGDRWAVAMSFIQDQNSLFIADGKVTDEKSERKRQELDADVEVLAVTTKHNMSSCRLAVRTCTTATNEEPSRSLLPAGAVVVAQKLADSQVATFQVDGKDPEPEVLKYLQSMLFLASEEDLGNQAVYGTSERKRIGDEWPINAEAATKDILRRQQLRVDPKDITGSTRLVAAMVIDGEPVLEVACQMHLENVQMQTPPGAAMKSSWFTYQFASTSPRNLRLPPIRSYGQMEGEFVIQFDQQHQHMVGVYHHRVTREIRFKALPP